jgi:hypothetical protein
VNFLAGYLAALTIEAFIARLQAAQVPDLLSYAQKRNWVKAC